MELLNLTPCDSCETPIPTDTHAEELGFCIKCSNDYFNHTCDKCGRDEVMNLNPPFTRLCGLCEESITCHECSAVVFSDWYYTEDNSRAICGKCYATTP